MGMIDAALRHPINQPDDPEDQVLASLEPYSPPLDPYVVEHEQFGSDFVDSILPVHRFVARWLSA